MGNRLIENSLKRYLKKKVKFTMALLTAFLITGVVAFAENIQKPEQEKSQIVFLTQNVSKEIDRNEYPFTDENYLNAMERLEGVGKTTLTTGETVIDSNDTNKKISITENNDVYTIKVLGVNAFPTTGTLNYFKNGISFSKNLLSKKTLEKINGFLKELNL